MTLAVPRPRKKSAFSLKIEAAFDAMPMTGSCDCGKFTATGPAADVREKLRAHRIAKHPERPAYAKRPKKPKPRRVEQNAEDLAILAKLNGGKRKNGAVTRPRRDLSTRPPYVVKWKRLDPDTLRRLYVDEGMSQVQVGQALGVNQWQISQALRHHGIPTRASQGHQPPQCFIDDAKAAAAWRLYEMGLSVGQIANLIYERWGYKNRKSCQQNLAKALHKRGHELRTMAETTRLTRLELPPVNRDEALAILLGAERKEAE